MERKDKNKGKLDEKFEFDWEKEYNEVKSEYKGVKPGDDKELAREEARAERERARIARAEAKAQKEKARAEKEKLRSDRETLRAERERARLEREEAEAKRAGSGQDKTSGSSDVEKRRKGKRNIETNVIAFIFVGIFAVMIIYFINFQQSTATEMAQSPLNPRNTTVAPPDPVRRGSIYAADGSVLAVTKLNDEGKEYRSYPMGALFSTPVGMERGGGSGIEGKLNDELLTSSHDTLVEVKSSDVDENHKEYQGNSLYTTLIPELQQTAYDALGDNKGAVLAIEPSTGKILCMVSKPTYDPNKGSTDYDEWAALPAEDSVLINRATQGQYPPGSTFKIFTAIEYMKENPDRYNNFRFNCEGTTWPKGGAKISCQYHTAHGNEDITKSFVVSCNCAFSTIGLELDKEKYKQTAEEFGFNAKLPIDDIESFESRFFINKDSSMSEVQETAFGQGNTMITPLQNLMITATVANGGTMMKPYLVDKVEAADGTVVKQKAPIVFRSDLLSEKESGAVTELMHQMVSQSLGGVFRSAYKVAGKTGQAEYENDIDKAHLWFTCFAPYDDPQIAVICVLEKNEIDPYKAPKVCREVVYDYINNYYW